MSDKTDLPFVSQHLHGLAELFAQRNAVYKDNFRMYGRLMSALFPNGFSAGTEAEHNKDHLFMLAMVKLTRYAINYRAGHKDSIDDLIVYLSMVAALDEENRLAADPVADLSSAVRELADRVKRDGNIFSPDFDEDAHMVAPEATDGSGR